MKVVILNAGLGTRLGELVRDKPKCLLNIYDNKTILDLQINFLKKNHIKLSDVYVIGGYKFEKLLYLKEDRINLIFNTKYNEYNNIYSFYLIRKYIEEDFILINGDVVFHPLILNKILSKKDSTFFVVDNVKKMGEEEMKVIIKDDRIIKFGKEINPDIADGEYIGMARIDINDAKIIFKKMEELIKKGKTEIWYEDAINFVLPEIQIRPLYTNGLPWIEVDTPEDYRKAKKVAKMILEHTEL